MPVPAVLTAAAPFVSALGGLAGGVFSGISGNQQTKLNRDQLELQKELGRRQQAMQEWEQGRRWQQQAMLTPAMMALLNKFMAGLGVNPGDIAMGSPLNRSQNPYYSATAGAYNQDRDGLANWYENTKGGAPGLAPKPKAPAFSPFVPGRFPMGGS